jgi:cellulase/cellobiase CelA1
VTDQEGLAINGATVTLGLCTNGAASVAPCPAVAANSPLITPNRNPETTADAATVATSGAGSFRWDVSGTNFWTVTASAPGCTTKTIGPLAVPPPRVDLLLKLTCASNAPGVVEVGGAARPVTTNPGGPTLPTSVVVRAPGVGQFGYCADVYVTNNTSSPVTWNTSFTVPGNQHISQQWNMVLTQGGNPNVATNVHADPSNPWNTILQPGQTTSSVGFCAAP